MESAIDTFFYSLFTIIACGILLSCCPCLMPLIILVESFHYLQLCIEKLQSSFFTPFLLLLINVSSSIYSTVLGRKGGAVINGSWLGDELWVNDTVFKKSVLPIQNAYQEDEPLPIPKPPSPSPRDTPFIVEKPQRSRPATKVTVERLHELLIKALRRRDGELWVIEPQKAKAKVEEKRIPNPLVQVRVTHEAEVFKKEKSSPVIAAEEVMGDSAAKEVQQLVGQERKEEVVLSQNVTTIENPPVQRSTNSHRPFRLRPRHKEYRFLPYNLSCWFKDCALYRKQKLHNTTAESLICDSSESPFKTSEITTTPPDIENSLNYVVTETSETVFPNANPEPHQSNPADSTTELHNPTNKVHQVDLPSINTKDITTFNITEATKGEPVNVNSPTKFQITNRCEWETNFIKMKTPEDEPKWENSPTHKISQYQADTETTTLMPSNIQPSELNIKDNYSGNNLSITEFSKADGVEVDLQNPDPTCTDSDPTNFEATSSESYNEYSSNVLQEDTYPSDAKLLGLDSTNINACTLQVSFDDIEKSALIYFEPTVPTLENEEVNHSVSDISTTALTPKSSESKTIGIYHSITENHFSQTLDKAKSSHNIPGTSENTETQVVAAEFSLIETPNIVSISANHPISETEIQSSPSNNHITANEPSQNEIEITCPTTSDYYFSTSGDANLDGSGDNVNASTPNISHHNCTENGTPNVGYHDHPMDIDNTKGIPLMSTNLATHHGTSINDTSYFLSPNTNSNIPFLIPNTFTISSLPPSIQSIDVSTTQQAHPHFSNSAPQTTTFSGVSNSQHQTTDTDTDTTMDAPQVSAGPGFSVIAWYDEDHSMADDATMQSGPTGVQQETDEEMAETSGEEAAVDKKATENAGADRHDEDMAEVEDAPGNMANTIPEPGTSTNLSSAQGPSPQQTPSTPSPSATSLPFTASLFAGPSTPKNPAPAATLSTSTSKKRGRSGEAASTPTNTTTSRVIAPLRGASPTIFTPEVTLNEAEEEEDWDAWSEEDEADFPDGEITEEQEAQARAYEEAILREEEEDREYDRLFALCNKSQDGKRARQRRE